MRKKTEGKEAIWQINWVRSTILRRLRGVCMKNGWQKNILPPKSTGPKSRLPLSCRRPISRGSCIWDTRWTIPCRTRSSVISGCPDLRRFGCREPTMPQSQPRQRSWRQCAKRASQKRKSAGRNFCAAPGRGRSNTAIGLCPSSKKWVLRATGTESGSPWTKGAPALLRRSLSGCMIRG